jgi:hypothetical protein
LGFDEFSALAHQNFAPFMLVIERSGGRSLRELGVAVGSALQDDGDIGALRARATVLDVTVRAPFTGDAITVKLEHSRGRGDRHARAVPNQR